MRNRVHAATCSMWPGNELPIFKGEKGKENTKKLDDLVSKLLPDCHYGPTSLPGVVFGRSGIRQHVLDTLNERRRRVHSGHDYDKVL